MSIVQDTVPCMNGHLCGTFGVVVVLDHQINRRLEEYLIHNQGVLIR